ncbi:MAG: glycoside hydrolase family 3 C-terminal domain-containing protein [Spirochaetes bacterium]|jgi:beta-glucosidase-like glycosyl hydrolase|nr:glycoside hydrolase family 3 C-terminal domain-containing protein [Spirochaetota bacterium]
MYKNSSLPIKKRVEDLLSKMTLEEKIAQLGGAMLLYIVDNNGFNSSKADAFLKNGIGEISRTQWMLGDINPDECSDLVTAVQKYLTENTRLGIPAIIHDECLTGYQTKGSTAYPQSIGLAATWNESLAFRMTDYIRKEMRAVGATHGLSPVLDIVRDARWGRVEESYGECPYLASSFAVSFVKGLQGEDLKEGVMATGKHFIGYGVTEGGLNWSPSHINRRELLEVYSRTFEATIREANLASIMNSYSEIDGVPCAVSKEILTDLLRDTLGFTGIVVADYGAVLTAHTYHNLRSSVKEVAIEALSAGLDIELPKFEGYSFLAASVADGTLSEEIIDIACHRVLTKKFELGLFENPYGTKEDIEVLFGADKCTKLAHEICENSFVLLKNEGALPIKPSTKKIAVIGPNADSVRNLFGDYTYGGHLEGAIAMLNSFSTSGQSGESEITKAEKLITEFYKLDVENCTFEELTNAFYNEKILKDIIASTGFNPQKEVTPGLLWGAIDTIRQNRFMMPLERVKKLQNFKNADEIINYLYEPQSVLEALKAKTDPAVTINYEKGCDVIGDADLNIEAAVKIAESSDIVIAVMGDRSGIDINSTTGEARDRAELTLPGHQQELLKEIKKCGKPIILVLFSGRPVALEWESDNCDAILEVWIPGEHGAGPIADMLLGTATPSGRLPISFPRSVGQMPLFYNHKPSGARSHWYGDYVELSTKALYPFGFGLSYTTFEYNDFSISDKSIEEAGMVDCSLTVKNSGDYDGAETVQIYYTQQNASVTRPVKQLVGYKKVHLPKGESARITFTLAAELFAFYDRDNIFSVEKGIVTLMVGRSSDEIEFSAEIKIESTFPVKEKVFFSSADMELL